ncbi:hypothetical protein EJ06DRAFT_28915 [Trichodelitschia bisporula]|uniref:Uncharacterized protein n=1 Tax=Trichodelitschia bisporula TaxID=703511 RepID=A0A6G1IBE8_9PEZI|nr:hypothetical protein EJ06DRAFT_28915 [Trichodelitschia bisporula]
MVTATENEYLTSLLAAHDNLVAQGHIHHGPSTSVLIPDNGFTYELRICTAWSQKPNDIAAALPPTPAPLFGPGSDIALSHPTQHLGPVGPAHIAALNAYPVFRPQLLLLTSDSYARQTAPLGKADIAAAVSLLNRLPTGEWYALYNCGPTAGCSRLHKHMQVARNPEYAEPGCKFRFWPDVEARDSIPFVAFEHRFDMPPDETDVYDMYIEFLWKCRKVLRLDGAAHVPHNVILCDGWMVVVPRRRGTWEGLGANAVGMVGSMTVSSKEAVERWRELGPTRVLSKLGVPKEELELLEGARVEH